MEILNPDQQGLLKDTRNVLSELREVLVKSTASAEDREALAESIRQLDELFLLVITGEFNSGKSSFINALLGQDLQTVGVTPTTSHVHLLKYGEEVTEKPIASGVWEHTAPVDLLRQFNIVDTPGTNAIVREHEAITAEFIPRSDLVLFITSADRPFSESERKFLLQIKEWGKKIVMVINKIDILENEADRNQVVNFVTDATAELVGHAPTLFTISTKKAQEAKTGNPRAWGESGFEKLEDFIYNTLDDAGRFALKLSNPLGVGQKLIGSQLDQAKSDLNSLQEDKVLLDDIERQMTVYDDDMQRNFQARLSEIDNVLKEMEIRGTTFFDETVRVGRIPDLLKKERIQLEFEQKVVADTSAEIEEKVTELIDWMVEQDLRQWTAVADHMQQRSDQHKGRIVGSGFKEGSLAYNRQQLVQSLGRVTREAVATYDKDAEAIKLAASAKEAVVNTGMLGAAGLGLGVGAVALAHTAFLDATGALAGIGIATLGLVILPRRREKAKRELSEKLEELRVNLMGSLTKQFEKEMTTSANRIEETVSPFSRFVRAEETKLQLQQNRFTGLDSKIVGIKSQLQAADNI